MTRQQKVASFQISYAMCMAAQLKEKEKPKTALWNALNQLEEYLGKTLDRYRIQHFNKPDLDRAVKLFDRLDAEIASLYPTEARKRQNRRLLRCNQAWVERTVRRGYR